MYMTAKVLSAWQPTRRNHHHNSQVNVLVDWGQGWVCTKVCCRVPRRAVLYNQLKLAGPLPYFLGGVHKQHCVLIITALVQTSVVASRSTPATC